MESSNRPNEQAHQELYEAGIEMRRKVMVWFQTWQTRKNLIVYQGNEYVNNQLKTGVSEFMKPMQEVKPFLAGIVPLLM
jgi:4-carboxymuconolactone decarboxylase